jgi:hypothetical protein
MIFHDISYIIIFHDIPPHKWCSWTIRQHLSGKPSPFTSPVADGNISKSNISHLFTWLDPPISVLQLGPTCNVCIYTIYIYNIRIYIQCMSNMSTILCPAPGLRRGSPRKLCPVQRLPERTFCQICGSELKSCWDYHKIMLSGLVWGKIYRKPHISRDFL